MTFSVEVYEKENGEIPFVEFIQALPEKLQAKVLRSIDLLEEYGSSLREPYSKHIDDGIFELRTKYASDITRSMYFFFEGNRIVITHGFVKKQQKMPVSELQKAKNYREDWLRRKQK